MEFGEWFLWEAGKERVVGKSRESKRRARENAERRVSRSGRGGGRGSAGSHSIVRSGGAGRGRRTWPLGGPQGPFQGQFQFPRSVKAGDRWPSGQRKNGRQPMQAPLSGSLTSMGMRKSRINTEQPFWDGET